MKKNLIRIFSWLLGLLIFCVLAVIALGVYKFNFTNDDIFFAPELPTNTVATNSAVTAINQRYFGNEAKGDLNGDGKDDKAYIITEDGGGSGTFFYIKAALATSAGFSETNSILLGDRIAPQTTEIKDGKLIVNYADRKISEPMTAQPTIGVSKYFVVTDNKLVETAAPTQIANPASTNCIKLGGNLVIEKRGDGGEYGLCYFEDNRACEEWALLRGDCPFGGRKTTGFDTIDQKYCAWLGGDTFAVPNSVCIFKNGSKCPTIDFYNGTCLAK